MSDLINNNIFWILVSYLIILIECIIQKAMFDKFSTKKKDYNFISRTNVIYICFFIFSIILTYLVVIHFNIFIKLSIAFTLTMIIYTLNYEVKFMKILTVCILYYMLTVFVDTFSTSIILILSPHNLNYLLNVNSQLKLEFNMFDKSIILITLPILKVIPSKKSENFQKGYFYLIATMIINIISILIMYKFTIDCKDKNLDLYLLSILIIVIDIYAFYISKNKFIGKENLLFFILMICFIVNLLCISRLILVIDLNSTINLILSIISILSLVSIFIFSKVFELNELKLFNRLNLEKIRML